MLLQKQTRIQIGSMSVGGGFSSRGIPGWSQQTADKTFDMPELKPKQDKAELKFEDLDEKPNFMDDPPVGCQIPNLKHGGREPQRRSGYRVQTFNNYIYEIETEDGSQT